MTPIEPLQSLLKSMKDKDLRLKAKLDQLTTAIQTRRSLIDSSGFAHLSSPGRFKSHLSLLEEFIELNQRRSNLIYARNSLQTHIFTLTGLVSKGDLDFKNFPVFPDVNLAEDLARNGRIEENRITASLCR